jgi:hypothetical protein
VCRAKVPLRGRSAAHCWMEAARWLGCASQAACSASDCRPVAPSERPCSDLRWFRGLTFADSHESEPFGDAAPLVDSIEWAIPLETACAVPLRAPKLDGWIVVV